MEDADSPGSGSPLSDIDSDELEEPKFHARSRRDSTISAESSPSASVSTPLAMPPSKRRRVGGAPYDQPTPTSMATPQPPRSPTGSISSDSTGSVPTSPSFAQLGPTHPLASAYAAAQNNPDDPEMADFTQVTRCLWDGCPNPDQGHMDNLVAHINEVHIVPKGKKFYCEWEGCNRKSMPHASGYALRAHMRSHTKEKPFLCALPECDRSFTRSDALAKHMRTVHETEALRPSDPVPRGHTGGISNGGSNGGTLKRIKLVMGNGDKRASIIGELPPLPTKQTVGGIKKEDTGAEEAGTADGMEDAIDIDELPFELPIATEYYPADVAEGMDEYERNLPPSQYFRLLRRQVHWAEQESTELTKELGDLRSATEDGRGKVVKLGGGDEKDADRNRKVAWLQTEALLDNVLKSEVDRVWEAVTGRKVQEEGQGKDPWQMVRGLEALVPQD